MTIESLSNRPREISVTEPIEPAYERVKTILFRPFDLTKWIVIGFCAWLAGLGESGGGGGFSGFNGGEPGPGDQAAEHFRHVYHQTSDYVLANLDWILPLFLVSVCLGLAIWLLILWLNSRGKFMFLHCVVWNVAEVDVPWRKYTAAGNSLFRFRIAVGLAGMVTVLPLLVFLAATIIQMVLRGEPNVAGVMLAIGLVLALVLLAIVFSVVRKFATDFVVPIMFLRGSTISAAWREFGALLSANPGKFIVYILFQIVLGIAISAMILAAILATCCIAFCFLLLPFVGTVLLLPVLVFKRAYPLYYLAQFGPQYDVFPKPPAPPATSDEPSPLTKVP